MRGTGSTVFAARQRHEQSVEDALVERRWHNKLDALAAARASGEFLPFVNPGELLAAPMRTVTDGDPDEGRPQACQRTFENLIFVIAGCAADGDWEFVGREAEGSRGWRPVILRGKTVACGPDQHIRGPNDRHAVFRNGVEVQLRISGAADDWGVREREGLPLQKVVL